MQIEYKLYSAWTYEQLSYNTSLHFIKFALTNFLRNWCIPPSADICFERPITAICRGIGSEQCP